MQSNVESPIGLSPVYPLERRNFFYIAFDLRVQLSDGSIVIIPKGFKTDLSSVPRWLWALKPPFGNFLLAALIHDYLYVNRIGTRRTADREMLIWSNVIHDNLVDNFTRWLAVRLFGRSWWKK